VAVGVGGSEWVSEEERDVDDGVGDGGTGSAMASDADRRDRRVERRRASEPFMHPSTPLGEDHFGAGKPSYMTLGSRECASVRGRRGCEGMLC